MLDFAEGISATTTTTTAATATDRRLLPPPPPLPLLLLPIATWLPYLTSESRKSPWTSRPYGCAAFFYLFGLTCTHAMNHATTTHPTSPTSSAGDSRTTHNPTCSSRSTRRYSLLPGGNTACCNHRSLLGSRPYGSRISLHFCVCKSEAATLC